MTNTIIDTTLTRNQTELAIARAKVLDLIADRVPEIEFAEVKGGLAFAIGDGQFAILGVTVKKEFDVDGAVAEFAAAQAEKARKAAEAAAKKNKK